MKDEKKNKNISRREFMGTATAAVAAFTFVPKRVLAGSAGNKLNIAGIGVGGRGASDLRAVESENIVALCDVDLDRAKGTIKRYPESRMKEYGRPPEMLPRSVGHHQEWIDACKAGKPENAKSGFWYAGPFVEALLVGNLAVRLKKRVEWDSKTMRSPNCPEADNYITKFYRAGWTL